MKQKKRQNTIIIFSFLLILILPIVFMNRISNKVSPTENRYLAQFPQIFDQQGKPSPGLRGSLKNWLDDNIGFRERFMDLHAWLSLNIFNTSPSAKVEKGKDGWYYYTLDHNLDIPNETYPMTNEMLAKIAENQEALSQYYKSQGIDYVLVLNPSKASVYPENIRSGAYKVGTTVVDTVADYLRKNSDVKVITTKEALLQAKKTETVCFKTDTHWNLQGSYVGYTTVINQLKNWGIINTGPVPVKFVPSYNKGEFSSMMGNVNLLPPEPILASKIISPKATEVEQGGLFNKIAAIENKLGIKNPSLIFTNPSAPKKSVLVYGDSMFANWNIPQLFAENFSNYTYIWSYQMDREFTNAVKPDVVIMDIGERYDDALADLTFNSLIHEPLKNPQAQVISTTTPTQVERGKMYNINITVKNTGTENWSEKQQIRLCIFQDGKDCGYRIKLPDGVEVKSGQTYTFILQNFHAPSGNSTYLEYQMAEEGVNDFGQKKRVDLTLK